MTSTSIRLLIVDDQAAIRDALAVMLDLAEDVSVIGTAANGREAVNLVAELTPDVVLMDLNMPVLGGVDATQLIHASRPEVPVVVLTTFHDDDSVLSALRAGACGYLTKNAGRNTIVQAVRSAHAGQSVLDPDVQMRLLDLASRHPGISSPPVLAQLTARESEILELIGLGLHNHELAHRLSISEATVKTHINNIFAKAALHSRADAVRLALTIGATHHTDKER